MEPEEPFKFWSIFTAHRTSCQVNSYSQQNISILTRLSTYRFTCSFSVNCSCPQRFFIVPTILFLQFPELAIKPSINLAEDCFVASQDILPKQEGYGSGSEHNAGDNIMSSVTGITLAGSVTTFFNYCPTPRLVIPSILLGNHQRFYRVIILSSVFQLQ